MYNRRFTVVSFNPPPSHHAVKAIRAGALFLGESRRKSRKCSLVAQQGATFSQYAPRLRQNEASMRNQYFLASSDPGSSRPFRRGGEGERAPPRRRRRAALGPMPYGNLRLSAIRRKLSVPALASCLLRGAAVPRPGGCFVGPPTRPEWGKCWMQGGSGKRGSRTGHWQPPVAGARPEATCGFSCS